MERSDQLTVTTSTVAAAPAVAGGTKTGGRQKKKPFVQAPFVTGMGVAPSRDGPGGFTSTGFHGTPSGTGMSRTETGMSELRTNEVRAPGWNVAPPSLHGHRWASAGLTTDLTGEPGFPEVPFRAGEERSVPFPPPPPPMHSNHTTDAERRQRLMVWYQCVESWCDEGAKADNERVIVAPPPRPPPFTSVEALMFSLATIERAPYEVRHWETKIRFWWSHVSRHFDKLRSSDRYEMKGISKAAASVVTPQQAINHMAL